MGVIIVDLSRNIIKRYVQVASPEKITSNSETVYGTVVNEGETLYVKIDGSNILTPVSSTIDIKANDRVLVLLKNHEATVIGSPSSPTARLEELNKLGGKVTKLDTVVADKVGTGELVAIQASIDDLHATDVDITGRLTANEGYIDNLTTENTNIKGQLKAYKADVENLSADHAGFKKATAEDFKAVNASIENLNTKDATIEGTLNAHNASIDNLTTTVFDAETGKVKFADIDFANIGEAAVEKFYAVSGIIQNLTLETGVVVKELIGVLISGDLIKGNTIKADKLVVRGEDGLYYKLNIDALGETTASADSKYQNGLDGSVIIAKSIAAEKVSVSDLVAFGATIGGFHITKNSIYSGLKESASNTELGLYLDNEGQIALGDEKNYLKFYKEDGTNYVFEISLVKALQEDVNSNAEDIQSLPKRTDLDGLQEQITGQGERIDGLRDTTNKLADDISANATAVEGLDERITSSDGAIQKLNASVNTLLGPAAYIREGTVKDSDDSELPCLELGKEGSVFKVRITNKEIQFIDDQSIPAYISNQKLMIEKAQVENELLFGGFVWKKRSNGNMGLTWEGAND